LVNKVTNKDGLLKERVAIITGATNGMGRGCALMYASEGAKVVVVDILDGSDVVKEITEAGGEAIFIEADVRKEDQVVAMVEGTVKAYGQIDILMNNAGLSALPHQFEDFDSEMFDNMIDTNCKAIYFTTKYSLPYLEKSTNAVVINTLSMAGVQHFTHLSTYGVTKAAAVHLTKILSRQYSWKNIRVNSVCPGVIDTPMNAGFGHENLDWEKAIPLWGRRGTTEDIANLALFLASDLSCYITGQIIICDGGYAFK